MRVKSVKMGCENCTISATYPDKRLGVNDLGM